MKKKVLFIQPYYFYGGHYFQAFNHLIKNLYNYKNYDFMVSINKKINNKSFENDFKKINKYKKIYTFNSSKNTMSVFNVIKAFIKCIFLKKKIDIFFYYEADIFALSCLYFFFPFFFKNKETIVYTFYSSAFLRRRRSVNINIFFIRNFLKKKRVKFYSRSIEHRNSWRRAIPGCDKKINIIPSLDYPPVEINKVKKIRNGKLKFGSVGQIRLGKSLDFLNDYFLKNKKYDFLILGGYADKTAEKNLGFINSKFIEKKKFLEFDYIIKKSSKLDYLVLLYDDYLDINTEVSSFFLAVRLRTPIICFPTNNWLRKVFSKYKAGIMIKSVNEFKNFPSRNSKIYKKYIGSLKRYERDFFDTKKNEKNFYNLISK
tara:strand:+ start:178 stop:1293 length:1116 start_codon:yes stop_codon:yes gene_type:complete